AVSRERSTCHEHRGGAGTGTAADPVAGTGPAGARPARLPRRRPLCRARRLPRHLRAARALDVRPGAAGGGRVPAVRVRGRAGVAVEGGRALAGADGAEFARRRRAAGGAGGAGVGVAGAHAAAGAAGQRERTAGPGREAGRAARPVTAAAAVTDRASEEFARVEEVQRVEGTFHGPLHLQPDGADLPGQPLLLQDADPVLAGDGAAEFQTERHDLVEGLAGAPRLVGIGGVEADGGVGVAVARVGDDADGERVLPGDP